MAPRAIVALVGVYNADGTLTGELAYWIGARLGRAHCSLCDITHGLVRERDDWKACAAALPVPFETFHRNDQPVDVRAATGDRAPAVVARLDDGSVVALLEDPAIEACAGSADALAEAIGRAAERNDLAWSA